MKTLNPYLELRLVIPHQLDIVLKPNAIVFSAELYFCSTNLISSLPLLYLNSSPTFVNPSTVIFCGAAWDSNKSKAMPASK
ncbi:hypothetical protein [Pediococcus pentosaceus]|uniref:hypothetical protein n=1 Tax=Pediococcus pentosaceus TaxID=1255 RepID=UPI000C0828D3|nr:hypothetical protein [Pediococcus pentosaceus]